VSEVEMSELKSVPWVFYLDVPLRGVVGTSVDIARRTVASLGAGALRLENALERRLMEPGPPRSWDGQGF
jgi:hypothetical protein